MSRFSILFSAALAFAIISTAFAGVHLLSPPAAGSSAEPLFTTTSRSAPQNNATFAAGANSGTFGASQAPGILSSLSSSLTPSPPSPVQLLFQFFEGHSLALAPTGWFLVGGLWVWRGRMRARWEALGFDSDVFQLFIRMRGGKTRIRLMSSLSMPKDRFQLAQELGLDWKAVDRHVMVLDKYGFVHENAAYGKVRMYELTPMGRMLLQLLEELAEVESTATVPRPL